MGGTLLLGGLGVEVSQQGFLIKIQTREDMIDSACLKAKSGHDVILTEAYEHREELIQGRSTL